MKKVIVIVLALILAISTISTAAPIKEDVYIGIGINKRHAFNMEGMGQPFLSNSRTFVPLRFVSEKLGFKVEWEPSNETATVFHSSGDVIVKTGSNKVKTPSGEIIMDVEAFIKDERIYVPIRFIAEALGFKVDWMKTEDVDWHRDMGTGFYINITGLLPRRIDTGNTFNVTNIISNNPADWPKTNSERQTEPGMPLSRNKPYIDYLEANYPQQFHVEGYTDRFGGPNLAIGQYKGIKLGGTIFEVMDMRLVEYDYSDVGDKDLFLSKYDYDVGFFNTINMDLNFSYPVEDVFEKTLYALVGVEDGDVIFDYYYNYERGTGADNVVYNKWNKAPGGSQYQIQHEIWWGALPRLLVK